MTVGEVANKAFPDMTWDVMPKSFTDECRENGFEAVGHMVWVYPSIGDNRPSMMCALPGPLTEKAEEYLLVQAIKYQEPQFIYKREEE